VDHRIHARQTLADGGAVADVVAVTQVEDPGSMTPCLKRADEMGSDEAASAGHEDSPGFLRAHREDSNRGFGSCAASDIAVSWKFAIVASRVVGDEDGRALPPVPRSRRSCSALI